MRLVSLCALVSFNTETCVTPPHFETGNQIVFYLESLSWSICVYCTNYLLACESAVVLFPEMQRFDAARSQQLWLMTNIAVLLRQILKLRLFLIVISESY
ncbi:hypothetical protein TNCT_183971 [Trichonephila clavata]|uniref:Uncharacterized protein n=1 Tax=Trichonephila clavata TaxID=2740835 RepID=A0A8X6KTI6_TRICU|nr:hypothetical protein TNCT_183971 [Trichonephila clavata]